MCVGEWHGRVCGVSVCGWVHGGKVRGWYVSVRVCVYNIHMHKGPTPCRAHT